MPKTINKTCEGQIIGGTFSSRENADKAVQAFQELDIPQENIQMVIQLDGKQADDAYTSSMVGRGVLESQALYYDKAVREGKILVAVHDVTDPAPVIDVFDEYKAEYNPNGSRNLRDDVAGMTVGAAVGAVAGGVAGTVVGGPGVGTAAGAAVGAVVGGGSGAAAGKAIEHRK